MKSKCHFSLQAQYLVKSPSKCHFSLQVQYLEVSLFVAGAVFGEVELSLFVAGAVFREIWNDSRSAKCCIFQCKMFVMSAKSNLGL